MQPAEMTGSPRSRFLLHEETRLWICRRRGFMDNPPKAGLPTSSTPAWTTLRVAHILTASAAVKDLKTKDLNSS